MSCTMKSMLNGVLSLFIIFSMASVAAGETHIKQLKFKEGKNTSIVKNHIKGRQTIDYHLRAKAGQSMTVSLKSKNHYIYFNVLAPETDNAMFVGSTSGDHFAGSLPREGEYTIRVYLMSKAARHFERAKYSLNVSLSTDISSPELTKPTDTSTAK